TFVDDPQQSNVVGRLPSSITRVTHAQLEKLVEMQPDLVIVSDFTEADFLQLLEASGLRYYRMGGLETLEGIRQNLLGLARAVGEEARGQELVSRFDSSLAALAKRLE